MCVCVRGGGGGGGGGRYLEDPLLFIFLHFLLSFIFYFITSLFVSYSMLHVLNFSFVFITLCIINNGHSYLSKLFLDIFCQLSKFSFVLSQ